MNNHENDMSGEFTITGISGSPGICIGKAYLVDREGVDVIENISSASMRSTRRSIVLKAP